MRSIFENQMLSSSYRECFVEYIALCIVFVGRRFNQFSSAVWNSFCTKSHTKYKTNDKSIYIYLAELLRMCHSSENAHDEIRIRIVQARLWHGLLWIFTCSISENLLALANFSWNNTKHSRINTFSTIWHCIALLFSFNFSWQFLLLLLLKI